MKIGDAVECVEPPPESSLGTIGAPLVAGAIYTVLGVRDADLGPPRGECPDELRIRTSQADPPGVAMWYPAWRFRPVDESRANATRG